MCLKDIATKDYSVNWPTSKFAPLTYQHSQPWVRQPREVLHQDKKPEEKYNCDISVLFYIRMFVSLDALKFVSLDLEKLGYLEIWNFGVFDAWEIWISKSWMFVRLYVAPCHLFPARLRHTMSLGWPSTATACTYIGRGGGICVLSRTVSPQLEDNLASKCSSNKFWAKVELFTLLMFIFGYFWWSLVTSVRP